MISFAKPMNIGKLLFLVLQKSTASEILVYFETTKGVRYALQREENLKHWWRAWKIALIENGNPEWNDPYHVMAR